MEEVKKDIEREGPVSEQEENGEIKKSHMGLRKILKDTEVADVGLMVLGTVGCVADGATVPVIMLVISTMMNTYAFNSKFTLHNIDKDALTLVCLAVGVGFGAFLEGFCWARTAERQTSHLRKKYLKALLRQDPSFFEMQHGTSTSQVVSSITTDTLIIQDALSEKIPNFIMNIATYFTSQLISFYLCWRLAIIAVLALSLLVIPAILYVKLLADVGRKMQEAYRVAGKVAEQALSSIRIIFSYVRENQTEESFSTALEPNLELGFKQGLLKGLAIGSTGVVFAVRAFQAWYGSILVIEKGYKGGDVFIASVCVIIGGAGLANALGNLKYLTEASVAASLIFEMTDRVPNIDSYDQSGDVISDIKGEIEFNDVDFAYPSRPGSMMLRKFNLKVKSSQTVGLVGESGSGKSTIISLIERFYDPLGGEIYLDGTNIMSLQLRWLRHQIGLVSQEPILFGTSIKDNILFGKEDASMGEVISAAKAANAHNFINQLPNGYDTHVGQFGDQMSGGQKQMIAIARALLKDPRILLLDEATSVLDSRSEKAVQDALDEASVGRTTIVIAHRLSTLRNANLVAVLQSGQVVEFGPHDQLTQNKHGLYSTMVQLQQMSIQDDETSLTSKETESNDSPTLATVTKINTEILHESFGHGNKINQNQEEYSSPSLWYLLQMTAPEWKRLHESFGHGNKINQNQEEYSSPSLWYLLQMTAPEWKRTISGCIGAFLYGAIFPLHSYCIGAVLSVYSLNDHNEIRSNTKLYSFMFLVFAIISFITNVIQHYNFGVMGEHLTKRVREKMLGKVLTFEIEWFDQESNSSAAICSRLATEASKVRSLICDRLALLAQVLSGATLAVILGLSLAWRLASLIIALQPLIIGCFYARGVLMKSMSKKVARAQNKSSNLASEAVVNHRTITAFSSQDKIMELFEDAQKDPRSESQKQSWYAGLGLFVSRFLTAANAGLIFWYGGRLLYHGQISYKHLFQTFFILVTTGRVIAEAGSMTSDLSKGIDAIKSVLMILERKSKMEPDRTDGIKPQNINGYVELKEVDFAYPTRPRQVIFTCLNLKVEAGKSLALVGQSGSGKSTIIGLIERFYDPLKGSVEIDGVNIKMYNLRALRSHIGLVSQEPTLFAGTIHENIAYGRKNATEAEIMEAATIANAHEFISCMADGYQTYCGERGVQLSGGQKQRIAIARAILKNPAILLLDEATSALDYRSKSHVQEAIEKMMVHRTCIVIAHTLSTIQNVDSITVIENGRIVEEGTHGELLSKGEKGAYCSLLRLQNNETVEMTTPKNHM